MPTDNLAALLATIPAFSTLSPAGCGRVASFFTECHLAPGDVLAREGDRGDALYLVLEGSLRLTKLDQSSAGLRHLGEVDPGEITGELGLLTGQPRAATITTEQPAVVASLSRVDFESLCFELPEEMEGVIRWMRKRLESYQIKAAMDESPLLSALSVGTKSEMAAMFEWRELRSGEVLFREGEAGDALYLIVSGRIELCCAAGDEEARADSPGSEQILAQLGKGDTLGEMALLTNQPRSATAVAIRDTQLASLSRESFDRIVGAHPHEMLSLFARQLAERLREKNLGQGLAGRPPVSIAILACSRLATSFGSQLASRLSAFGPTLYLSRESFSKLFLARPLAPDAAEIRVLSWLNEQETRYRHVLYETEAIEDSWTFRCLRQADVVILLADGEADPHSAVPRPLAILQRAGCKAALHLALVHSKNVEVPRNTKGWLDATKAGHHWHLRAGTSEDLDRVARFLTGRSVGLALGGGFALGLAHIGVIQALRESKVPIDYVGGASMGSIVAATCALHLSHHETLKLLEKGCANSFKGDYTLPIVSLLTGKKVARSIGSYLGSHDVEDLWLPFFAISASLVHARMVIHTQGNALRCLLASCRAPGVFPPLGWNGDVLVDGGLVNNVPCDVMRGKVGPGTVIAADVAPSADFAANQQFDLHLSGWRVAGRKVNSFLRGQSPATIADILARLVRLGGVAHVRQIRSSADLYLSPPLDRFTMRDFKRGEEMARVGYEYTRVKMQQWIAEHGRPWEDGHAR